MQFDATFKDLARASPLGLLTTFDCNPPLPVRILSPDLSTVTALADVVYGIGDPLREVVHFDFQASASATKHADVMFYNALLYRQYHVPVHSIAVLLRPKAAHSNFNGAVTYSARPERGKMDFRYEVIALWERPVADLLGGEIGVVPLAILGRLPVGVDPDIGLTRVVEQISERILREAPPEQVRRLLTAAFVLTGLRVTKTKSRELFQGVKAMRESESYMGILEEGAIAEVKKLILRVGQRSLGTPDETVHAALSALAAAENLERLERMIERIHQVKSWQELLEIP
jgi:predicted transposase YdaD